MIQDSSSADPYMAVVNIHDNPIINSRCSMHEAHMSIHHACSNKKNYSRVDL